MAVKILTDSTSSIKEEVRERLDIKIISLYVSYNGNSEKEIEIKNEVFYKKIKKNDIPKSSQPSAAELYEAMVDVVSKGHDLLCVFVSSDLSGTYNSACMVKEKVLEEYPNRKIYILDSRSTCMQLGYAAIVAAIAAKKGCDIEKAKKVAKDNIKRSRILFTPDNLKYLEKGGRIGGASALIGNMLRIKPILTVKEGKADIFKKIRTKRKALRSIINQMLKDNLNYSIVEIVVGHINCYDEVKNLAKEVKKKLNINPAIIDIGPVIGLHVGPGTVGLIYYTEDEIKY